MDAIEALKTRRSVRAYKPDPVPADVIRDIVDCGRLAATAINIQPWEFVVVTDAAARQRIAATSDYGKFIADAPVCIVVLSKDTKYYLEDGSAATQNILVAARAHGLGSCWVAGDKKTYAAKIPKLVGAPKGYRLIALIAIGYAAAVPKPEKRGLAEVLHWETF
ncbi:MAG TPA: nitroreductase family protein [Candidatus Hydrogenedentes bacterium]|nr:nitroreductase family protein [Candidatus Hydrogenedentota bacterium]HIJ73964.1 nitroreductase family protein [Candidatus Hydrogenedentota bacterium]